MAVKDFTELFSGKRKNTTILSDTNSPVERECDMAINQDVVMFNISKECVLELGTRAITSQIKQMIEPTFLFKNKVRIYFKGFEKIEGPWWRIPEIRKFYRKLDDECPLLPIFIMSDPQIKGLRSECLNYVPIVFGEEPTANGDHMLRTWFADDFFRQRLGARLSIADKQLKLLTPQLNLEATIRSYVGKNKRFGAPERIKLLSETHLSFIKWLTSMQKDFNIYKKQNGIYD